LSKIAKDNGLTLKQLLMQNPQITDPNKISIGQNLSITTTKDGNMAAI
jgi:LysM repeat protein